MEQVSDAEQLRIRRREWAAELRAKAASEGASALEWRTRWHVSLAVGNGAGGIGLATALINGAKLGFWLAILPGLWCFVIGLVAAGSIPFIQAQRFRWLELWTGMRADEREEGGPHVLYVHDDGEEWTSSQSILYLSRNVGSWERKLWIAQIVSAGGFIFGLVWPLTVITFS